MSVDRNKILLVEDNSGDQRLILEALRASGGNPKLDIVSDGAEAIEYLRQRGKFAGVSLPGLIILDLNLPKKDGREVLAEIKQDPDLRRTPVVVLTTSKASDDIRNSYDAHANCYITKPVDLEGFFAAVRLIEQFWLSTVQLPG